MDLIRKVTFEQRSKRGKGLAMSKSERRVHPGKQIVLAKALRQGHDWNVQRTLTRPVGLVAERMNRKDSSEGRGQRK